MKLFRTTKGASLSEYAILTGLVAVVAILAINMLGYKVTNIFIVTEATIDSKISSDGPTEVATAKPSVVLADFRDNKYDCSTDPDCGTYYTDDPNWHDLSSEAPDLTAFRMLMNTPNAENLGPYLDASAQPADQTLLYDNKDGAYTGWNGGAGFDTLILSQISCQDLYFQYGFDPGSVEIMEITQSGFVSGIDMEILGVEGVYCSPDDSYYSVADILSALGPQQSGPTEPTYADLPPALQAQITEAEFNDPNFNPNNLPPDVQSDFFTFYNDWFNNSAPSGPPMPVFATDLPPAQTADQVDSGTGGGTGGTSGDTSGDTTGGTTGGTPDGGFDWAMCDDPDYAAAHPICPQ